MLRNISLSVERGQHIAIVGENGAGKSTLVKIITGLYQPTAGAIMLDDQNLRAFDIASWHTAGRVGPRIRALRLC